MCTWFVYRDDMNYPFQVIFIFDNTRRQCATADTGSRLIDIDVLVRVSLYLTRFSIFTLFSLSKNGFQQFTKDCFVETVVLSSVPVLDVFYRTVSLPLTVCHNSMKQRQVMRNLSI